MYRLAIPSYKRPMVCLETVRALQNQNCSVVPDIFVSGDSEFVEYQAAFRRAQVDAHFVRTDATNVVEKFNAIHNYYAEGKNVFVVEDDVRIVEDKKIPYKDIDGLVAKGFKLVRGGGLWGIAPHSNAFYYGKGDTQSLKLVVAHAFGFVSTRDPKLAVTLIGKSDYERTLRYWVRYGRVGRLACAGVNTKSYTAEGGMQADLKTAERAGCEELAVQYLTKRFPHLIRRNAKKQSLFAELSFSTMQPQDPRALQQHQRKLDREQGHVDELFWGDG